MKTDVAATGYTVQLTLEVVKIAWQIFYSLYSGHFYN